MQMRRRTIRWGGIVGEQTSERHSKWRARSATGRRGGQVIVATGFCRLPLSFLLRGCFDKPYGPPNRHPQKFPPLHPSIPVIDWLGSFAVPNLPRWNANDAAALTSRLVGRRQCVAMHLP